MSEHEKSVLKNHKDQREVYVVTPRGQRHMPCLVGQADALSEIYLADAKKNCYQTELGKCGLKSVVDDGSGEPSTPYLVYGRVLRCEYTDCPQ